MIVIEGGVCDSRAALSPVPLPLLFMMILHASEASHKRIRPARPRGVAQQTREVHGTEGQAREADSG